MTFRKLDGNANECSIYKGIKKKQPVNSGAP